LIRRALIWVVMLAVVASIIVFLSTSQWLHPPRVKITGAPASGPPHVSPELQDFDSAALAAAADAARQLGTRALIVSRRSHIVLEKYWNDTAPRMLTDSGTFSAPLSAVMLGIAMSESKIGSLDEPASNYLPGAPVQTLIRDLDPQTLTQVIERATGQPYAQYVSEKLWKRIGASDAYLSRDRVLAYPADWMRLAEVLANDGVYLGEEILRPGWVKKMQQVRLSTRAQDFAVPDIFVLDGGTQRLWISPSLKLSILQIGGKNNGADWSDTRIPNLIINSLKDYQPPAAAPTRTTNPADYAPGH
jgi:hypothetical protein